MKVMVYHGANDIRFEERPRPQITDLTDTVVKTVETTIRGTDLGIWKGKNPEVTDDRTLDHEGISIVEEAGEAVKNTKVGDRVIIPCVSKCRTCDDCKVQPYSHCCNGGWVLGHMIDGTQAEYVRTPHADNSLVPLPDNVNEEVALLLSDVLSTAHEIGVQYDDVEPGDIVSIADAGPVGMSALSTAQLYSPAATIIYDMDENRLKLTKELDATYTTSPALGDVPKQVFAIVGEDGADCAIEAVGIPATWNMCQDIVKPGGHIVVVGVHDQSVDFKLEELWIKDLVIITGLVNASTTEMLTETISSSSVDYTKMLTHRFEFSELEKAYDVFKHAVENQAMKVVLEVD